MQKKKILYQVYHTCPRDAGTRTAVSSEIAGDTASLGILRGYGIFSLQLTVIRELCALHADMESERVSSTAARVTVELRGCNVPRV